MGDNLGALLLASHCNEPTKLHPSTHQEQEAWEVDF
jgi:hypothetical protein